MHWVHNKPTNVLVLFIWHYNGIHNDIKIFYFNISRAAGSFLFFTISIFFHHILCLPFLIPHRWSGKIRMSDPTTVPSTPKTCQLPALRCDSRMASTQLFPRRAVRLISSGTQPREGLVHRLNWTHLVDFQARRRSLSVNCISKRWTPRGSFLKLATDTAAFILFPSAPLAVWSMLGSWEDGSSWPPWPIMPSLPNEVIWLCGFVSLYWILT